MYNKSTVGMNAQQLAKGTPSDKVLELRSYYKDAVAHISPAKDINGRYLGIKENISEVQKLEMGYVPTIESRMRIYDGIKIDLNNPTIAKDWEWMVHCVEIAENFATGQSTRGAYFYIHREGVESAKNVSTERERVKILNYILSDSPENIYSRVKILGTNMDDSVLTDVQEYLMTLAKENPSIVKRVYESNTFSLELLFLNSIEKGVINKKGGVYTFGELLLGVDKKAVINFFLNSKNRVVVSNIEAIVYGNRKVGENPMDGELITSSGTDDDAAELALREQEEEDKKIDNSAIEALAKKRNEGLERARKAKADKKEADKNKK